MALAVDVGVGRVPNWLRALESVDDLPLQGVVSQVVGLTLEATGPALPVGELVLLRRDAGPPLLAEVVGFRDRRLILMPWGDMHGIGPGTPVEPVGRRLEVPVGPQLLGRVLDGLGRPLDGRGPLLAQHWRSVDGPAPHPLARQRIVEPIALGVRAIDALVPCGKGQRLGIFAGSGVGKSTLLGMIARQTAADVICIALIGERGREVREFLERDLGPDGLKRSVVIVATSDQPALVRRTGAFVATAVAESFRDQGLDVLLVMDSLTRFAMAQREVGLAAGEPPATKGYPPSVFALLPKLLERSGPAERGTITGLYTVLVEGDDLSDPVADAARSVLDGHIVLSRALAERGHYPAIDVLASVSRTVGDITTPEHRAHMIRLRDLLAAYRDAEDLISIGAYVPGSHPRVDEAVARKESIDAFLRQGVDEHSDLASALADLERVVTGPLRSVEGR